MSPLDSVPFSGSTRLPILEKMPAVDAAPAIAANAGTTTIITEIGAVYAGSAWTVIARERVVPSATSLIISIPDSKYHLLQPIPVQIEISQHGDVIATFVEVDISMSGDTEAEAIELLAEQIAHVFMTYSKERSLGPLPTKQLKILGKYLGKSHYAQRS